jgi:tetratricopeptide (TPR) repeat protein
MKEYLGLIALLCCFARTLPAQYEYEVYGFGEEAAARGDYYEVYSDNRDDAEALVQDMELRLAAYNRLFRFDPETIQRSLRVRAFTEQEAYDTYVSGILGNTCPGAVYVHYSSSGRRELLVHRGSAEETAALPHQAFIQFLRACIPNPPAWIRDGFAVYFSTLQVDHSDGQVRQPENLDWLETVKALGDQLPALYQILMADFDGVTDNFPAVAWALVSFFMNSGSEDYFRTLGELFMVLSPEAGAADNASAVMRRLNISADMEKLEQDFRTYILNRQTFPELIAAGRTAYTEKDPAAAECCFLSATDIRPSHFAPYYYLGLLAYDKKDYGTAESYYRKALEYGADAPLVNYALGLNAASAGHADDAKTYLEQAASADPGRYGEKVRALIARLTR